MPCKHGVYEEHGDRCEQCKKELMGITERQRAAPDKDCKHEIQKPIFELPPPPKRKVRKVIEGWVNIYHESLSPTEGAADICAGPTRLGEAHFIRHGYEEIEE